jgi:hypothetical protein
MKMYTVIPAQAGIHRFYKVGFDALYPRCGIIFCDWIPACARMTDNLERA